MEPAFFHSPFFSKTYSSITRIRILDRTMVELNVPVVAIPAYYCTFFVRVLVNSYCSAHIRFVLHMMIILIVE